MRNCAYILTALLLSFSCAYAEQESNHKTLENHRMYVGPDVFFDLAKGTYASQGGYAHAVASNAIFGGVRLGYDYLKPQAFYFGTDGLVSIGRQSFTLTYFPIDQMPCCANTRTCEIKESPLFANIEQRYGYTFQSPISAKSTITPFSGVGGYYIRSQFNHDSSYTTWMYAAAGFRKIQQFCENFDIGVNLKVMYAFAIRAVDGTWSKTSWRVSQGFWGYEVALPFIWHVGSKRWDLQFQPYFLKLKATSISQIYGLRLQAGYSF